MGAIKILRHTAIQEMKRCDSLDSMEIDLTLYFFWHRSLSITETQSDFFENIHETSNQLHNSLLSQIKKPVVAAGCKVLGLVSKLVSAPLWRLLEESHHIMEMNRHYQALVDFFARGIEDSSAFLRGEDCPFTEELIDRDEVLQYLVQQHGDDIEDLTGPITKTIFTSLHRLLLRMTQDHLPGGRYDNVSPAEQVAMESVTPHNKLPGFFFGQLDFLVRYRPNATALVNESFLMYSMNQTGRWLDNMDPAEKETLIGQVRKEERSIDKPSKSGAPVLPRTDAVVLLQSKKRSAQNAYVSHSRLKT